MLKTNLEARYGDLDFYLTGSAVMDATFLEAIQNDILFLVPFQVIAIVALLIITLQSISLLLILLAVLAVTTASIMGLAGWLGQDLNGVTSATGMVLMGLIVATCIHLLITWQQEMARGAESHSALATSLRINLFPVFLAALTTAISFLCLNFSDAPPFRQLGNLVGLGIGLTFILAFTLLPALLTFVKSGRADRRAGFESWMKSFGNWVVRRRTVLLALFVGCVLASGFGASRLVFDDNFAKYFSEDYEFRRSTDFLEEHLSGLTKVDFSISSPDGIDDPDFLQNVASFESWLAEQPKVAHVEALTRIIRGVADANPGIALENGLPVSEADAEIVMAIVRNDVLANAPEGRPLSDDGRHLLLSVILRDASSADTRDFATRADNWRAANASELASPATGMAVMSANMSARNTRAMVWGTIVALLLVSSILLFALRSLSMGLASLAPNLLPMVMAFGIWGLVVGEVSFAATVVSAMTFGIVVDDSVHFLWKYRYARRNMGMPAADAVPYAFSTVGVALVATTLAIVSGFLALAFSGFLVNAHLGALTGLTLCAALAVVFLFLPPLLLLQRPRM